MIKDTSWLTYAIAYFIGYVISYLYCSDENT